MRMRPSEKRQFDRGVTVGIALACSTIQDSYNNPFEVASALVAAGLNRRKLKEAGVSEYDLKVLRPVFRELAQIARASQASKERP